MMKAEPSHIRLASILICSKDRQAELVRLVHGLRRMHTRYAFELVVVEETDDPIDRPGVMYVPHPVLNKGIPFARNLALSGASGEIVVFLDDDCMIHDGWLDALLEPFEDPRVVGVQGGVTVPGASSAVGWAESILGFPGGGIRRVVASGGRCQETREISTLNCAYRKSIVEACGGFDDRLELGGEDYVLAKHVCDHGRCLFAPGAMVSHAPRENFSAIWRWFVRRGRSDMAVVRLGSQRDRTILSMITSSLSLKLFLIAFLAIVFSPAAFVLMPLLLSAYLALQYIRFFRPWRLSKSPLFALIVLPFVKIVMDLGMDWGRLRGC